MFSVSRRAAENFAGFDKTVFFVYPEYKLAHAVIYGVKDASVTLLGDMICGYDFALSDNGMLRTSRKLAGAHSSEIDTEYYRISADGAECTLSLGELLGENDTVIGYCVYADGESQTLSEDEYAQKKQEADKSFENAKLVSLDTDSDFRMDEGCESFNKDSLYEYILGVR